MTRMGRFAWVIALALMVSACGWQLRGAGGGGFEGVPVAVGGAIDNRLVNRLEARLRDLEARVVADPADARVVIDIADVSTRRRTVATDADGFASEYELRYRIRFALRPGGQAGPDDRALPQQTVRTTASYPADPGNLQGRDAQARSLRRSLRDEALQLLLSRVGRQL
jgi:LPS-assembly lipoprotein